MNMKILNLHTSQTRTQMKKTPNPCLSLCLLTATTLNFQLFLVILHPRLYLTDSLDFLGQYCQMAGRVEISDHKEGDSYFFLSTHAAHSATTSHKWRRRASDVIKCP